LKGVMNMEKNKRTLINYAIQTNYVEQEIRVMTRIVKKLKDKGVKDITIAMIQDEIIIDTVERRPYDQGSEA
jgi:hypothetical protein